MGLWIQEPAYDGPITGTVQMMVDDTPVPSTVATPPPALAALTPATSQSTTVKVNPQGIVLNPQPQDNPNDPLNWPVWKRDLGLCVIGWHLFIVGGQTPLLAAGLSSLGTEFGTSVNTTLYLVGGYMLALGVGSVFAAPTAVLYGKRVVYLVGILIFIGGSIWGACANSFGLLLGARILTGLGSLPCESLPLATIAETYFAHERAYRTGIYTMLLLGGKNLVPMLAGFVFQQLDRHWLYWILTIILGINLVLTFMFAPETFWDRTPTPNKQLVRESEKAREIMAQKRRQVESLYNHPPNSFAIPQRPALANTGFSTRTVGTTHTQLTTHTLLHSSVLQEEPLVGQDPTAIDGPVQVLHEPHLLEGETGVPRRGFMQELRITSGVHSPDKWWMVALRPFVLLMYPLVLYGALMYTFAVVWLIMILELVLHLFHANPYNYLMLIIGLFYILPFLGGTLGLVAAGKALDILVRWLVKRNHGTYEPEFRLIMCIPVFLLVLIGLLGYGWLLGDHDMWIVPVVFFGIVGFGCLLASTTAITYTIDLYKMFAAEALVTLNLSKNVVGFLFSLFNVGFIDAKGPRDVFATFAGIQIALCLAAIPLYLYGKQGRRWTDQREFMRWLYVKRQETA